MRVPLCDDRQCRAPEPLRRVRARRAGGAVNGDPLADISLLDSQGEHVTHIMKDGVFYKRR
jgi:hypothetical protein